MKRMLSLAALCLTATLALAQEGPPPQRGPDIDRLELLLDLDAGQKIAVEKILAEQRAAMQEKRKQLKESGERPSRDQMKAQFAAQRTATIDKLRPVLSDVQLKKFEALTDRPYGPPRGTGKHPDAGEKNPTAK